MNPTIGDEDKLSDEDKFDVIVDKNLTKLMINVTI